MSVFPFARFSVVPDRWRHGYHVEHDADSDSRTSKRYINASGRGTFDNGIEIVGGKSKVSNVAKVPTIVSFHSGGQLEIDANLETLAPGYLNRAGKVRHHSGWFGYYEDNESGDISLDAEIYLDDDIFKNLFDCATSNESLPTEISLLAAASALQNMHVNTKWDISGQKYLFIVEYTLRYGPIRQTQLF